MALRMAMASTLNSRRACGFGERSDSLTHHLNRFTHYFTIITYYYPIRLASTTNSPLSRSATSGWKMVYLRCRAVGLAPDFPHVCVVPLGAVALAPNHATLPF